MVDDDRYDIEAKVAKNNKEVNVYSSLFNLHVDSILSLLYWFVFIVFFNDHNLILLDALQNTAAALK